MHAVIYRIRLTVYTKSHQCSNADDSVLFCNRLSAFCKFRARVVPARQLTNALHIHCEARVASALATIRFDWMDHATKSNQEQKALAAAALQDRVLSDETPWSCC